MSTIQPLRGEVWFAQFDPTIGHEQAKKRPCIVLSANDFNQGASGLLIVVPLTTRDRKNPLHIPIIPPEGGVLAKSFALSEQIRAISRLRLSNHCIGRIKEKTLLTLEFTIKTLLDFN